MKKSDIPFCDVKAAYYADPENVVVQFSGEKVEAWKDMPTEPAWSTSFKYRIKPKTITINGIEVPAPETVAPVAGASYWIAAMSVKDLCLRNHWQNEPGDFHHLVRGVVHLERANAIAHTEALILASSGTL